MLKIVRIKITRFICRKPSKKWQKVGTLLKRNMNIPGFVRVVEMDDTSTNWLCYLQTAIHMYADAAEKPSSSGGRNIFFFELFNKGRPVQIQ
jgi:hypothetical protein